MITSCLNVAECKCRGETSPNRPSNCATFCPTTSSPGLRFSKGNKRKPETPLKQPSDKSRGETPPSRPNKLCHLSPNSPGYISAAFMMRFSHGASSDGGVYNTVGVCSTGKGTRKHLRHPATHVHASVHASAVAPVRCLFCQWENNAVVAAFAIIICGEAGQPAATALQQSTIFVVTGLVGGTKGSLGAQGVYWRHQGRGFVGASLGVPPPIDPSVLLVGTSSPPPRVFPLTASAGSCWSPLVVAAKSDR